MRIWNGLGDMKYPQVNGGPENVPIFAILIKQNFPHFAFLIIHKFHLYYYKNEMVYVYHETPQKALDRFNKSFAQS